MKKYTLYIDENHHTVETSGNVYTTIAGLAVDKDKIVMIDNRLKNLKKNTFVNSHKPEDIVLHEVEINRAHFIRKHYKNSYKVFLNATTYNEFYTELHDILKDTDGKIFGVTLKSNLIKNWYPKKDLKIREYLYCLPIIMENFLHFLKKNNAKGEIVIESFNSEHDTFLVKQKYYKILANGTMFFDAKDYIDQFEGIKIIKKTENNNLLQLVDFIPNRFNKNIVGRLEKNNEKNKPTYFYHTLKSLRYDGDCNQAHRFGIKIIPKQ